MKPSEKTRLAINEAFQKTRGAGLFSALEYPLQRYPAGHVEFFMDGDMTWEEFVTFVFDCARIIITTEVDEQTYHQN
jgi:hypothetical protein